MSDDFPFSFFSAEQVRFVELCRHAVCSKATYWQNRYTYEIFCTRCFYSEPLINRANIQFVLSHIVAIFPVQLTPRCSICHRSTAVQIAIPSCDRCWDALAGLWAILSEPERREIESGHEGALLYVAGERINYEDL